LKPQNGRNPLAGREDCSMSETKISFISNGKKLAGTVRVPDSVKSGEKRPAFIVMHGFGSNSSSSNVL
jgi:poly(3-hydroxybutyrate) depolymerase